MNFSELFKHTGQLCRFSPDGNHLANAVQYRLIVRDSKTLQIKHLFTCLDAIQHIEWSADSEFLLCGMHKRGLVQVWSLEQPEWTCKIDEGSAGLADVCWSPDSRHVLTTAEFHLRITVWSLTNKSVSYIKYPKACQQMLHFSTGGHYLALAERRDCKDYVSIFNCNTWQLLKHFETDTEDLAGLEWAPDGRVLAVWDSCLQYKVLLYSMDGRCLSTFNAYEHALGVKSINWSPTSQFLAVGSYDQKVRLLNNVTWTTIVELDHPTTIENNSVVKAPTVVYKEVTSRSVLPGEEVAGPNLMFSAPSKYEVVSGSHQVACVKPDLTKGNPRVGVGTVAFSPDNKYMYTRNDNMPTSLFLWDIRTLSLLSVLQHDQPIKCVQWDKTQSRLALCTGNNKIYMWSPAGCLSVEIPCEATFSVHSLCWHPDGKALLLISREQMCVCFLGRPATTDTNSS